ncbi:hypothetical protein [Deinococcus maricopensis]|uniref:Uncharacterized protein n=1 Tax=Deinococcus maricopensis (strain DSM 21211 / LMG 22137 / NRRL B-23946 / LB-34) TaxID=709986 RepID=E8U6E7_DEIML|nr:hypothetical protein [Deinococcus maricopensis]ADV66636.1 hypothetical protein Deima_0983 [Deinococcus maricopensis DSM 21211]
MPVPAAPARTATAAQAALLLDERYAPVFTALAQGEAGAAEVARRANRPLSSVHAQLTRLHGAGVVDVVAVRARAGRTVRVYGWPRPWHIPFAVTAAATLRELLAGPLQARLSDQLDTLAWVLERDRTSSMWAVTLDVQDNAIAHRIHSGDWEGPRSPLMASGVELRLSPGRVRALQERLTALMDELAESPDEGGERWSLTVLLSPSRP